jgi:hypothetical protein
MCDVEGCELDHCAKCGEHYDPSCCDNKEICDGCQLTQIADETDAIVKAFGGNSEKAAQFMGW